MAESAATRDEYRNALGFVVPGAVVEQIAGRDVVRIAVGVSNFSTNASMHEVGSRGPSGVGESRRQRAQWGGRESASEGPVGCERVGVRGPSGVGESGRSHLGLELRCYRMTVNESRLAERASLSLRSSSVRCVWHNGTTAQRHGARGAHELLDATARLLPSPPEDLPDVRLLHCDVQLRRFNRRYTT